ARVLTGQALSIIFAIGITLMSINFLVPKLARRQVSDTMPTGVVRAGIAGSLGIFSSLLGIGGGTVAVIVMTLCGRSIHKAIATAAGFGFI
ncbi:TSUP family transporter, partial [Escherichia coli]|uniref:TSUP family transporter n=1 Tax=Escherichia coli TaxID=562 RepID=UPI003D366CD9